MKLILTLRNIPPLPFRLIIVIFIVFLVEDGNNSELLTQLQGILNSPLLLSLATFALVAILLILVGFCIVRQVWCTQWKNIIDDQIADTQDHPKFLHPVHFNNEYDLNLMF